MAPPTHRNRVESAARYHPRMLGTLFRVLILRLLGGRAAAVLAIVALVFGWRSRRVEPRVEQGSNGRATGQPATTDRTRVDRPAD
jgi:hypothetical protein